MPCLILCSILVPHCIWIDNTAGQITFWVGICNWIIVAIGKHVITEDSLTGGGEGIGIEESADLGIVITGLEIVERDLSVLCVPPGGK